MAVYHGLASKHPLVPQLARQMRSDGGRRSSAGIFDGEGDGKDMHSIGIGGRRSSAGGMGGPRASDVSRESVDKARRLSKVKGKKKTYNPSMSFVSQRVL